MKTRKNKAIATIEILITIAILCCVAAVVFTAYEEARQLPLAYSAWCKTTGNKGDISYEEWKALNEAQKPQPQTVYLYH